MFVFDILFTRLWKPLTGVCSSAWVYVGVLVCKFVCVRVRELQYIADRGQEIHFDATKHTFKTRILDWNLFVPPPLPLCKNYTGGLRDLLHYVAVVLRKIHAFLISIYKQVLNRIICLDNVLLCYLRVNDMKLKQHQLAHVFELNMLGTTACWVILNLCVTLIEKQ